MLEAGLIVFGAGVVWSAFMIYTDAVSPQPRTPHLVLRAVGSTALAIGLVLTIAGLFEKLT